jgi:uncharacterized protein YpuA (DUF1002 family)
MNKFYLLIILLLLAVNNSISQNFKIKSDFYNETEYHQFKIHVKGYADFNDSMKLVVILTDTLGNEVFNKFYDFSNPSSSNLDFTKIDTSTNEFNIELATFENLDLRLLMKSFIGEEIKQQIYILYLKDEEE